MRNIWLMSKPYFKWRRSFQCGCIGHVFKITCNGNIFHPKLFGKSNDLEHTPINFDIFHSNTPFWLGVDGIVNCLKIPWLSQELLKLVEMYSPPSLKQKTLIFDQNLIDLEFGKHFIFMMKKVKGYITRIIIMDTTKYCAPLKEGFDIHPFTFICTRSKRLVVRVNGWDKNFKNTPIT